MEATSILTGGTISARAAKVATTTVPIVFTTGDDPVRVGLVASLNRPGGNLTGVSVFTARLVPKRLIHEMVPTASPIAVLINPTNPDTEDEAKDILEAARSLGVQIIVVNAGKEDDLDGAFATLVQRGARALIVGADTVFTSLRFGPNSDIGRVPDNSPGCPSRPFRGAIVPPFAMAGLDT